MPIKTSPDLIKGYADGTNYYQARQMCIDIYNSLRVHADGEMPSYIKERRPSESDRIQKYRECVYKAITKPLWGKVLTSLTKIRRSPDWEIVYSKDLPASVSEDESLYEYCEVNYPEFGSVTSWAFAVLLKELEVDANACGVIWPQDLTTGSTEYLKPVCEIFNSPQKLDVKVGDYAVLLSDEQCCYMQDDKTYTNGQVIYVVTTEIIERWTQSSTSNNFIQEYSYPHGLGYAPFRITGGIRFKTCAKTTVYESRLQNMVPCMDEAAAIYSDLQAEIVQHVHSDKWIFVQTECRHCNGKGRDDAKGCDCEKCHGVGYVQTSPYSNLILRPTNTMEGMTNIPTPPAGYIQKTDVALMVDRIKGLVEDQKDMALSAVNMEFLSERPLNQSGIAKAADADESNNTVHSIAEDIVNFMDWMYAVINDYRYQVIVPDKKVRKAMLPMIPVPEKFDLFSSTMLLEELTKVKTSDINPVIQNQLQIEYANKKFYANPQVKTELETIFTLDPFPNISEDDKMTRLANNGITLIDYVISSNIQQFVRRAMDEDTKFIQQPIDQRKKVIEGYAKQIIDINTAKETISKSLMTGGGMELQQPISNIQ